MCCSMSSAWEFLVTTQFLDLAILSMRCCCCCWRVGHTDPRYAIFSNFTPFTALTEQDRQSGRMGERKSVSSALSDPALSLPLLLLLLLLLLPFFLPSSSFCVLFYVIWFLGWMTLDNVCAKKKKENKERNVRQREREMERKRERDIEPTKM